MDNMYKYKFFLYTIGRKSHKMININILTQSLKITSNTYDHVIVSTPKPLKLGTVNANAYSTMHTHTTLTIQIS